MYKTTLRNLGITLAALAFSAPAFSQATINLFDEILFYDGYAAVVSEPVPDGVIRHRNDLYATKIPAEALSQIGTNLTLNITLKAACDNYDRIGNVNLALVPKGATGYVPSEVQHLEIARFITPFMNKNVMPNEVPYTFNIANVAAILRDETLNEAFDFWMELQVFGVPYAAQTQVAGCAGHIDTFYGTLDLVTSGNAPAGNVFLLPLSFQADFNNYNANATDAVGTTVKTINFTLDQAVEDAKFFLITSNHGANEGGEEYVRRWHYVDFNEAQITAYRPGGASCEPYRQYNTQGNGIYGSTVMPTAWWASWNNWCPGNVIPIRQLSLGNLEAGEHSFRIRVPSAQFADGQGNFPLSVYLQGENAALATPDWERDAFTVYPNPTSGLLSVYANSQVRSLRIFNAIGQLVKTADASQIDLSDLAPNVYIMEIEFASGVTKTRKIVRN